MVERSGVICIRLTPSWKRPGWAAAVRRRTLARAASCGHMRDLAGLRGGGASRSGRVRADGQLRRPWTGLMRGAIHPGRSDTFTARPRPPHHLRPGPARPTNQRLRLVVQPGPVRRQSDGGSVDLAPHLGRFRPAHAHDGGSPDGDSRDRTPGGRRRIVRRHRRRAGRGDTWSRVDQRWTRPRHQSRHRPALIHTVTGGLRCQVVSASGTGGRLPFASTARVTPTATTWSRTAGRSVWFSTPTPRAQPWTSLPTAVDWGSDAPMFVKPLAGPVLWG